MVSFRSGVTIFAVLSSLLGSLYAVPLAEKLERLSPSARGFLKRTTPAPPYFVAYNDKWLNPLPSSSDLTVSENCPSPADFPDLMVTHPRDTMFCKYLLDSVL
ncbi:hypothetical protein J3R82DRAFT_9976 [Butyriboletus roseoflavus]|nr:hypothetical protein J3R82DRAFT_9976 [Butyriboletus roseoflavus]